MPSTPPQIQAFNSNDKGSGTKIPEPIPFIFKSLLTKLGFLPTEINRSVKNESYRKCHIVIFTFCIINSIEYGNSHNYTCNKIFEDTTHFIHLQSIRYSIFLLKNLSKYPLFKNIDTVHITKNKNINLNSRFHCSNPKNRLRNNVNAIYPKKPKRNTLIPLNCLISIFSLLLFSNFPLFNYFSLINSVISLFIFFYKTDNTNN